MQIVRDPLQLEASAGGAFVPTMGALHEGHLALVRRAGALAAPLIVSVFVNPTQFGPGEDWHRYPRTPEEDAAAAEAAGVDVLFAPDVEAVYPPGGEVPAPPLPGVATRPGLEDAQRPGHLAGVCQVVARLFDLVRPGVAVFGEKDYQQLLVVEAMVREAGRRWGGLRIVGHPTVREPSGLALSSRNASLKPPQREQALGLYRALTAARQRLARGADPAQAEREMGSILADHRLAADYAVVRDARTLEGLHRPGPGRALVAARVGDVRLIDNLAVERTGPGGAQRAVSTSTSVADRTHVDRLLSRDPQLAELVELWDDLSPERRAEIIDLARS